MAISPRRIALACALGVVLAAPADAQPIGKLGAAPSASGRVVPCSSAGVAGSTLTCTPAQILGAAGTLSAAQLPALTGDLTTSGSVATLATVNGTPGTVGSGATVPIITTNAKGLVTGISSAAINAYVNGPGLNLSSGAFSANFGTAAGTIAQGNDSRITGAAQKAAANTWPLLQTFNVATLTGTPSIYHSTIIGQGAPVNTSFDILANSPAASGGVRNFFANIGYTCNDSSNPSGDCVGLYSGVQVKALPGGQAAPANFVGVLAAGSGDYLYTGLELDTNNSNKVMDCSSGQGRCAVGLRITGISQYSMGTAAEIGGVAGSGPMWKYGLVVASAQDYGVGVVDNSTAGLYVAGTHNQQIDLEGAGPGYAIRVAPSGGANTFTIANNGNTNIAGNLVVNSGITGAALISSSYVRMGATTFSSLSTFDPSPQDGDRALVTDASACATRRGTITGGGSTKCPAVYLGGSWVQE